MRPLILIGILLLGFVAGSWYARRPVPHAEAAGGRRILYYTDPMHPSYKSDKPGIAPDCGMHLEPVYNKAATVAPRPVDTVQISAEKQQLFGVRVGQAERSSGSYTMRLFGRVAADESRIYRLISGVDGIMQRTSAATTGSRVPAGGWLAEFSSPDFLSPMQAYVFTVSTLEQVKESSDASQNQIESNTANVQQTYDRLQSMGMSATQIEELTRTKKVARSIRIYAPAGGFVMARNVSVGQRFERGTEWYRIADLSRVWILADVPGGQAAYIRPGLSARVTEVDQKVTAKAAVAQVLPQFDAASRTLKVRLEADNPGFLLRPDMFVDVELPVTLPPAVTVPSGAVLDFGLTKTVFVERGEGIFEPRQVETGQQWDGKVEIAKGLEAGERIAISGNFLLDSESRMKRGNGADVSARTQGRHDRPNY